MNSPTPDVVWAFVVLIAYLAVHSAAVYFIVRWMTVRQILTWADHMEPFYKAKFIAGIRYAAAIADGTAHEPELRKKAHD